MWFFPALATRACEVLHTHRMAVKRMNLILCLAVQQHIIAVVSQTCHRITSLNPPAGAGGGGMVLWAARKSEGGHTLAN